MLRHQRPPAGSASRSVAALSAMLCCCLSACRNDDSAPDPDVEPRPSAVDADDLKRNWTDDIADEWVTTGPGGGGQQQHPSISPHDPSLMFVACDMSGFYRSDDSGATWRMHDQVRRVSHAPVFHPTNPDVVYVSTRHPTYGEMRITGGWRIWKSEDSGKNWSTLYAHEYDRFSTNAVSALVLDPNHPGRMWIGFRQIDDAAVMCSRDGGRSWVDSGGGLPATGRVNRLFHGPADSDDGKLYAHVGGDLFMSENDGASWIDVSGSLPEVTDLGMSHPGDSQRRSPVLYALCTPSAESSGDNAAIWRSNDGGDRWEDLTSRFRAAVDVDGTIVRMRRIETNRVSPERLYVSAEVRGSDGRWSYGVFHTADGGDSWEFLFPKQDVYDRLRRDGRRATFDHLQPGWIPLEFSWGWGGSPADLAVCQSHPDHVLWTDAGRTLGSQDGGRSWAALYSDRHNVGRYGSRGLEVTTCYRVVFDPHNKQRMWIAYTDVGNWRSDDRGKTWRYAMSGAKFRNTMYDLRADPDVPDRLYGVCSDTHDLPTWRFITRDTATMTGGFCVSVDGGLNWSMRESGLPNAACTALILDPRSDPNRRVLYLAAMGHGIYKTTDSGETWQQKVVGMEPYLSLNDHCYALSQSPDGTLYAGVTKRVRLESGKPMDSRGGALFVSEDGADNWLRIGPQTPAKTSGEQNDFSYLWDVAASPVDADEVIVACGIDVHSRTNAPGGLYRSRDKGASWRRIFENANCNRIDYHPTDPDVLFCGTANDGLFWSSDAGASWSHVGGLPFIFVYRTTVDPDDPDRIWVTTFGGGVWTGRFR